MSEKIKVYLDGFVVSGMEEAVAVASSCLIFLTRL